MTDDREIDELGRKVRALALRAEGMAEPRTPAEEDAEARRLVALLAREGLLDHERLSNRAVCAIREALAYQSGIADVAFVMQGLGSGAIARAGTLGQRAEYLPHLAGGASIAAIALTEAGAGSDLTLIATRARRDGDAYVVDGDKTLISNAGLADVYTLFARTADDPRGGLSAFIVRGDDAGLRVTERFQGLAPHPIGSLGFTGCRIPAARRLGDEGDGFAIAMKVLDFYRPTVGAAAVGMARRALDETIAHVKGRRQFGARLADLGGVQAMIADMAVSIDAAALLVERAALAIDSGRPRTALESAMAKYRATETAQTVIDRAVQLRGGMGVVRGAAVERLYREVRALRIYEGASEVQKNIIAREILRGGGGA
ncbi:MAG: acyl-CoA dehydrogenase family protein [Acidobacteria bacterium]|nr:acyl-CoA dehydrogenase family protein [Acidobacteriota bacterium]